MEKGERHRDCDPEFKKEVLRLVVDVFVGCSECETRFFRATCSQI